MYVVQRQNPLPIAQNFAEELMKNDRLLGSKAISLLRRVDQRHRVTANNCFWYAIQAGKLLELVLYLEPKIQEAERFYTFYSVTGEDYQFLRTLEV